MDLDAQHAQNISLQLGLTAAAPAFTWHLSSEDTKTQPSVLLKAYAIALREILTPETDLSNPGQAIFLATFQEKGIPLDCADEYANEALYEKADSVQKSTSLAFSPDGSSYFEFLKSYVRNVKDAKSTADAPTANEQAYLDAQKAADAAYVKLQQSFRVKEASDPSYQWQTHFDQFGKDYQAACAIRDAAGSRLPPTDLVRTMQGLDNAQARVDAHQGNNMRASTSQVVLDPSMGKPDRNKVDEKSVIMRPLYVLPSFATTALGWRESYPNDMLSPKEKSLDLQAAYKATWASLGFPGFDDAKQTVKASDIDDIVNKGGVKITLTYAHIAPFRVARGMWDIGDFREVLKDLRPDASQKYKSRINKTVSLLLGYGVQLKVQMAPAFSTAVVGNNQQWMPAILGGVSLTTISQTEFRTATPENDAYPTLLAVLAQSS